jgi:hypothetical protein
MGGGKTRKLDSTWRRNDSARRSVRRICRDKKERKVAEAKAAECGDGKEKLPH